MMKEDFESARQKYKPKVIKFLLIAEAPPKVESKRFFYFEDVQKYDYLFLETMKVLYPDDSDIKNGNTKSIRRRKREFLERFEKDGFYLIDASDEPIKDKSKSAKRKQIEKSLPSLIEKVRSLVLEDTKMDVKIILISSTVYEVCYKRLKEEKRFNVINAYPVPFPIGWQKEFREKLSELLRRYGWRALYNTA